MHSSINIINNNLFFEKGLLSEDIDWTIGLFVHANNFVYCPYNYYYYRQKRPGSITNSGGLKNAEDILFSINKWASEDERHEYQSEINSMLSFEYIMALMVYSNLSRYEKSLIIGKLEKLRYVLDFSRTNKTKFFKVLCKIFGIHYGAIIGRKLDKARRKLLSIKRKMIQEENRV